MNKLPKDSTHKPNSLPVSPVNNSTVKAQSEPDEMMMITANKAETVSKPVSESTKSLGKGAGRGVAAANAGKNAANNDESASSSTRDVVWLLRSLRPRSPTVDKLDAIREIKRYARSGSNEFWIENSAQVYYTMTVST